MAAPNQSPTAEPNQGFPTDSNQTPNRGSIFNQTPDQGSIFNQTPDKGSNQTLTPSSNQGATSRPHSGTNTSSDPATTVNSDPGTKVDRVIRTLPIDLNSAIFTSDGKAQQQTQYGYLVIYREALTYHFKERPHYAETLGFSPIFDAGLPQGYAVEYMASTAHNRLPELHVVGHPSGKRFRDVKEFAKHVFHILDDDVAKCDCLLCS